MWKLQERDNLLDHVNKVKTFADQLASLEVPVRDRDIVRTLLEILSTSYDKLMTTIVTMPMKKLTMNYVMACLMHEMSKHKGKDLQGEDVVTTIRQRQRCHHVVTRKM